MVLARLAPDSLHERHKAGAPDAAVRNRCGDLPRPPGVLGQDSSTGAGFWTMGYGHSVRCGQIRLGAPVSSGAFAPINPAWLADAVSFVAHAGPAPVPHFWNPNPFQDFIAASQADLQHPVRLTLALIAPLALCWMVIRAPLPAFGFAIFYVGVLLFSNIWNFPGYSRHHGIVFLAFVASVWAARAERPSTRSSIFAFRALLLISAVGGVLTLTSELIPFSQGRNVAVWLRMNGRSDAFLMGSRDAQVSTVAGYLGRHMYFLECECPGTYVVYNSQKQLVALLSGTRTTAATCHGTRPSDQT